MAKSTDEKRAAALRANLKRRKAPMPAANGSTPPRDPALTPVSPSKKQPDPPVQA